MQTITCGACDLDIPDTVECRLIHLVESHPDLYESEVLPDYHRRIAQLNPDDVPRFPTREPASSLFEFEDD
jgi:hypothetical protein